ncbi:MAG: retropepsin-like aspartic protease [Leeuwenhoekiella sp.]
MRFCLALSLLFLFSYGNAQELKKPAIIPFTMSPNGHIMITATINGKDGNFIFDTGAGVHLLTKKFADGIDNLKSSNHIHTGHRATGEAITTPIFEVDSMGLGLYHIKNAKVSVYDIDFPLDGLIGLTPFLNHPLTIDFKNKQLIVETDKSFKSRIEKADFEIPIQVKNDRDLEVSIFASILLNDTLELIVGLDSGAGSDVYRFNARYLENFKLDSTAIKSEFRPSYFDPEEGNMYHFVEMQHLSDINKNVIKKNFQATFIEGLIYEGIMGINWIGDILTIDIANKRLLVK